MDDLVTFLLARLDEDEAAARAAAGWGRSGLVRAAGAWRRDGVNSVEDDEGRLVILGDGPAPQDAEVEHIVRHDPARVLADVLAKRRIVNAHRAGFPDEDRYTMGWHDLHVHALVLLAQPYADHPDYDESWRP